MKEQDLPARPFQLPLSANPEIASLEADIKRLKSQASNPEVEWKLKRAKRQLSYLYEVERAARSRALVSQYRASEEAEHQRKSEASRRTQIANWQRRKAAQQEQEANDGGTQ